jgi:nucleoid-associated protein YgaU
MALTASSRYTTTGEPNTSVVIALRKNEQATVEYTAYTAREGDTFEGLAMRIYRDPSQYWRVADANPQVKFPDRIPAGTYLRLPA